MLTCVLKGDSGRCLQASGSDCWTGSGHQCQMRPWGHPRTRSCTTFSCVVVTAGHDDCWRSPASIGTILRHRKDFVKSLGGAPCFARCRLNPSPRNSPGRSCRLSKGHWYLRLADELDTLFTDEAFLAPFPRVGARLSLPGNWRSQRSSNSPKGSPIAKRRMPYAAASTGNMCCVWSSQTLGSTPQTHVPRGGIVNLLSGLCNPSGVPYSAHEHTIQQPL